MNKENKRRKEAGLPPLAFSARGEIRVNVKDVLESERGRKLVKEMVQLRRDMEADKSTSG